jgi:hypothetical protein
MSIGDAHAGVLMDVSNRCLVYGAAFSHFFHLLASKYLQTSSFSSF